MTAFDLFLALIGCSALGAVAGCVAVLAYHRARASRPTQRRPTADPPRAEPLELSGIGPDRPPPEFPADLIRPRSQRARVLAVLHETELGLAERWLDVDCAWIDDEGRVAVRRGDVTAFAPLICNHMKRPTLVLAQLVQLARAARSDLLFGAVPPGVQLVIGTPEAWRRASELEAEVASLREERDKALAALDLPATTGAGVSTDQWAPAAELQRVVDDHGRFNPELIELMERFGGLVGALATWARGVQPDLEYLRGKIAERDTAIAALSIHAAKA